MPSHSQLVRWTTPFVGMLCIINGCTVESQSGDTTIYSFALWLPGIVLLGSVTAFFAGLAIRRESPYWGWLLIVVSAVACVLFAPNLFLDKATVNKDRFTLRTGFWFAPTVHDVRFADLSQIELVGEERMTRHGKKTSYYLVCYRKSGGSEKVPVGDLMKRGPSARILSTAREQGVSVHPPPD